MKKLLFLLSFIPLLSFSQGKPINSINWVSLSEAEKYSEKYNKNMLIYFYRNNCDYCKRMKNEVLSDPQIIKLINENFFPVKLDGKSKNPIMYNGKKYINDVSIEEDPNSTWRHNLFFELVSPTKGNFYWPTIVIVDGENKKVAQLPGFKSKQQLLRSLGRLK
ncbi:MAG: thioredoxin family protein [Flavobacteriales bacterium]